MQIVYSEAEISEELKEYKKTLEGYGATVFLVPTGDDMKCVLKSQMIRLLAYHLPFVKDSDIIVTADVDAARGVWRSRARSVDDTIARGRMVYPHIHVLVFNAHAIAPAGHCCWYATRSPCHQA